jgi:hypothetical protein
MSIKNNLVAAGLLVALTGGVIGCTTATDTAKDAANKTADAAKDAATTTKDAVTGAAGGVKDTVTGAAGAAGLGALVSQVQSPLVQANTQLKAGKMDKVKEQFAKFETLWTTVGPKIKPLAGAKYDAIDAGVKKLSGIMGASTVDKTKAGDALTTTIKAMAAATAK